MPTNHKVLAVLKEIASLLETCKCNRDNVCLKLEININHGIPSRLTQCKEIRNDIPLQGKR
ncbi:MAG: hypothetical protein DELT_00796 [Desulfovibrio sp.]